MSAFVEQLANVVNEIRTKISVLPYRADESDAIELIGFLVYYTRTFGAAQANPD